MVVGLGIVCPLSMGRAPRWVGAALAAAVALLLGSGPIAIVIASLPVGVATWSLVDRLQQAGVRDVDSAADLVRSLDALTFVLVPVWAMVGAASLLASVAEIELFGIGEPIVRLTAVHYLYAGVGALTLGRRVRSDGSRPERLASTGMVVTAIAPPIVAGGFVLDHATLQIGGAALMTVGVWSIAAVLVWSAGEADGRGRRLLRVLVGLTPWVPMVLAVAWATAQHVDGVAALSVPDMARIHGTVNGFGFVVLGLLVTRRAAERAAA